jgi:hypothetical protein
MRNAENNSKPLSQVTHLRLNYIPATTKQMGTFITNIQLMTEFPGLHF